MFNVHCIWSVNNGLPIHHNPFHFFTDSKFRLLNNMYLKGQPQYIRVFSTVFFRMWTAITSYHHWFLMLNFNDQTVVLWKSLKVNGSKELSKECCWSSIHQVNRNQTWPWPLFISICICNSKLMIYHFQEFTTISYACHCRQLSPFDHWIAWHIIWLSFLNTILSQLT